MRINYQSKMVSNKKIFIIDEADSKDKILTAPDKCLDEDNDTQRDKEVAMVTGAMGRVDSIADSHPKDETTDDDNNNEPGSAV